MALQEEQQVSAPIFQQKDQYQEGERVGTYKVEVQGCALKANGVIPTYHTQHTRNAYSRLALIVSSCASMF